ncbi:molybdate ABC transporter permease subunit [Thermostilla marina]
MFGWLSPEEWSALRLSVIVAFCAATATAPLAVAVGLWLARTKSRGRWLVETFVDLPLVLPPVVTGYLLLLLLAPKGPVGSLLAEVFGIRLVFTLPAAVVAAATVGFPLWVRAARLAFAAVDRRLEAAARSCGAGPWKTFRTVTLPLARKGLLAGWSLAFARGLGEFGATIMVAGNIPGKTQTIPLAIFSFSNRVDGMTQVWRLVVLSIVIAVVALVVSGRMERRKGD